MKNQKKGSQRRKAHHIYGCLSIQYSTCKGNIRSQNFTDPHTEGKFERAKHQGFTPGRISILSRFAIVPAKFKAESIRDYGLPVFGHTVRPSESCQLKYVGLSSASSQLNEFVHSKFNWWSGRSLKFTTYELMGSFYNKKLKVRSLFEKFNSIVKLF